MVPPYCGLVDPDEEVLLAGVEVVLLAGVDVPQAARRRAAETRHTSTIHRAFFVKYHSLLLIYSRQPDPHLGDRERSDLGRA
jgi:hypothetical protein